MGDWDHPDDDAFSDDLERRDREQINMETTFWLTLIIFVLAMVVLNIITEAL